jgi:hypothetical protein
MGLHGLVIGALLLLSASSSSSFILMDLALLLTFRSKFRPYVSYECFIGPPRTVMTPHMAATYTGQNQYRLAPDAQGCL